MEYLDLLLNKVEENKDEMVKTLQELVRFPSVEAPAKGDMPFGENVHKAYTYMMNKCTELGFDVKNADNYGGHCEMAVPGGKVLGIVGHLDVVPEGTGWKDDPFSGTLEEGRIYGRGTQDNKGPVVASLYAMKALKDCGVPMKDTVRLILGLDEETNWDGMTYYLAKEKAPDYGFTPDADFPVIMGEMGIIVFDIAKKFTPNNAAKGLELRSLTGGSAPNMVADSARAVIRDTSGMGYDMIRAQVAEFRQEKKVKINCKGVGKSFEITTEGISAHGARPDLGLNAISIMMDFLGRLNFVNDDVTMFIDFYNKHLAYEVDGTSLGCGFSDEPSGKLILNVGKIALDPEAVSLTINIRYPVTMNDETVYEAVVKTTDKYNMGIIKGNHEEPIFMPADDPMIETLMEVYKKHTGDVDSKPLVIGGGTYARAMNKVVAYGAMFPGQEDLMHQKDEYVAVDDLMKMTKIYAEAIYRLAADV